jgi:predicted HAD superfamily Cof-like phosphohydrolase/predicted RNase H-like HicB family nuclease
LKTVFQMVREFHEAMGIPHPDEPCVPPCERRELRETIDQEEFREASEERFPSGYVEDETPVSIPKLSKELMDGIYVKIGELVEMGISPELAQACFEELHRSNMSKLGPDGKPIYREDGKVLKGPNYSPADLETIISAGTPNVEWSEEDVGWIATSPRFPGCSAFGFTPGQAEREWVSAASSWQEAQKAAGNAA